MVEAGDPRGQPPYGRWTDPVPALTRLRERLERAHRLAGNVGPLNVLALEPRAAAFRGRLEAIDADLDLALGDLKALEEEARRE